MLLVYDTSSRNPYEEKSRHSLYRIGCRIAKLAKIEICFPTERTIAADRTAAIRANCAHILSAYRLKETRQKVYRSYVHIAMVCCKEF